MKLIPVAYNWIRQSLKKHTAIWALGFLVIVIILIILFSPRISYQKLDPDSTQAGGTKAMRLLVEELGGDFDKGFVASPDKNTTALLLRDTLDDQETKKIERWIEKGGTLVLADSYSSFAISTPAISTKKVPTELKAQCSADFVQGINSIELNEDESHYLLSSKANGNFGSAGLTDKCFSSDDASYVVSKKVGNGKIIQIAGADILTNKQLNEADNAALVARLLLPHGENSKVLFLKSEATPGVVDSPQSAPELFPDSFSNGMRALYVAALIFVIWRWRRHGDPIDEEPLVKIPSSLLVRAVAKMMKQGGHQNVAAGVMRYDTRRKVALMLGVRPDMDASTLVQIVNERTGIDRNRAEIAFMDGPVDSDNQLLLLAQHIEFVKREVSNVR